MTSPTTDAAHRIVAARIARRSLSRLPEALRPPDEQAAYAVQDAVRAALAETSLGAVIGHKIGCTTPVMQHELGIDHPCSGFMYRGGLLKNGVVIRQGEYVRPGVECEIGVTIARALRVVDAPFDRYAIMNAVGSLHMAMELVDERYDDWSAIGTETLIADDFFHAGVLLGPAVTEWRNLDLETLRGVARIDGKVVGGGRGADIMGHPLAALQWLANHCAARGLDMPAGTIVSLGSVIGAWWLTPGEAVEMEFENLGALQLQYV